MHPRIALLTFLLTLSIQAETRRVYLGQMDLAGPPTCPSSRPHELLEISGTDWSVQRSDGSSVGYVPALFRKAIRRMQAEQLTLILEVDHLYIPPGRGKHTRVTLWTDTRDLTKIQPLIYSIPIHSREDLGEHE